MVALQSATIIGAGSAAVKAVGCAENAIKVIEFIEIKQTLWPT